MPAHDLPVIQKTYDLIKWWCEQSARWPRWLRQTQGERIERRLCDLLETLIQARYTKARGELLRQANVLLELIRYQVRLAHDLRALPTSSYESTSRCLHDIGLQVGGWASRSPEARG